MECENIFLFGRKFAQIFLKMLHSWDWFWVNIPTKIFSSHTWDYNIFLWDVNIFFPIKRPNYPYYQPLSPTVGYPPPLSDCLPPSLDHRQLPPLPPSIKGIFENIQNIPENLIYLSNTLKNTYLGKLFPNIVFSKILFVRIKIKTFYQTPYNSLF